MNGMNGGCHCPSMAGLGFMSTAPAPPTLTADWQDAGSGLWVNTVTGDTYNTATGEVYSASVGSVGGKPASTSLIAGLSNTNLILIALAVIGVIVLSKGR